MNILLFGLNFLDVVHFRLGFMRALARAGHTVTVLASHDAGQDALERDGFRCIPLDMERAGLNPMNELAVFNAVRRTYRDLKPDIAFHYSIKPNVYGSIAARLYGIPCINVVAGLGYVFMHDTVRTRVGRLIWRIAFGLATRIVTLNPDDARLLVEQGFVAQHRIDLVNGEGVDCDAFSLSAVPPAALPRARESFTFLFVGRILRDKGVLDLVEAARIVKTELPGVRVQLLGGIDRWNPSGITEETVAEWQRDGVVEYLGVTSDVRPFLRDADCVVLPSFREGLSHSLIEAASMERPLIASDVPGCAVIIDHGVTGFLTAPHDPASLADAMLSMARMPEAERQAMGAEGRRKTLRTFSDAVISEQLFAIIARVLGR